MAKKPVWIYGKSPNPSSWHEAAEILKQTQPKAKKPSKFDEAIQKLLKASK